jgi:hypothetical protein
MKKLTLDVESLGVESFATGGDLAHLDPGFLLAPISRKSCIEQCTTSCVP